MNKIKNKLKNDKTLLPKVIGIAVFLIMIGCLLISNNSNKNEQLKAYNNLKIVNNVTGLEINKEPFVYKTGSSGAISFSVKLKDGYQIYYGKHSSNDLILKATVKHRDKSDEKEWEQINIVSGTTLEINDFVSIESIAFTEFSQKIMTKAEAAAADAEQKAEDEVIAKIVADGDAAAAKAQKAKAKTEGVRIGMTKQEVLDSMWGNPVKVNRTVTQYTTHEQWVYNNNNYLYFDDGILTSIQN